MKKLFLSLLVLLALSCLAALQPQDVTGRTHASAGVVGPAPTFVNYAIAGGSTGSITCPTGNTLIQFGSANATGAVTVVPTTDTGNSIVVASGSPYTGSNNTGAVATVSSCNNTAGTWTEACSSGFCIVAPVWFSGANTTSPVDVVSYCSGTSQDPHCSVTTTGNFETVVVYLLTGGSSNPASFGAWTGVHTGDNPSIYYQTVNTAGLVNFDPHLAASDTYMILVVASKPAQ